MIPIISDFTITRTHRISCTISLCDESRRGDGRETGSLPLVAQTRQQSDGSAVYLPVPSHVFFSVPFLFAFFSQTISIYQSLALSQSPVLPLFIPLYPF